MLKRLFDVMAAGVGMAVLLPVLALVGVAIRLSSPGPVFYRCTRVGKDGQPFAMLKFRTMADGPGSDDGPRVTARDDPRITRLGALLRRTKLNELPQLINVLRGEMSLVGPRPEDPEFVAHYTAEERDVLSVRPGITSPASILYCNEEERLRYASATEDYLQDILPDKLRLDLLYVRRHSFLLDLDVLVRTVGALLPGLGRAAPEMAEVFVGPVQRLVREHVPWFVIDWATAAVGLILAGLLYRAAGPLEVGWHRAALGAFLLALAFSMVNRLLGAQRTVWQYASAQEAVDVVLAAGLSTALVAGTNWTLHLPQRLPGGLLLLGGAFSLAGFLITRYRGRLVGSLAYRWSQWRRPHSGRERVLVVGGGEAGQFMVWRLQNDAGAQAFEVVGIVDDDLWKRGGRIHRVRVLGDRRQIGELVRRFDVGLIIFAIHHIATEERAAILALCRETGARVVVVPDIVGLLARLARRGNGPLSTDSGNGFHGLGDEGDGLAVAAETVAEWLGELQRLAAGGAQGEVLRRLAELRAGLSTDCEHPSGEPGGAAGRGEGGADVRGSAGSCQG